jgi:thioredoxin reductase
MSKVPGLLPFIVIGAGPAGLAAAVEAARQGVETLVLDASGRAGGAIRLAHEVRNVPFLPARCTGAAVVRGLELFAARWGVTIRQARVTRIEATEEGYSLVTGDGRAWRCARLVVATGTHPRHPAWKGAPEHFAFPFVASARAAVGGGRRPVSAIVAGGGDVAWDQARYLLSRGVLVTVLTRSRSSHAPAWLKEAATDEGARWIPGVNIAELRPFMSGLELRLEAWPDAALPAPSGGVLRADCVVSALGHVPSLPEGAMRLAGDGHETLRLAGDATGSAARHVVAAMGDGCRAAFELLQPTNVQAQP